MNWKETQIKYLAGLCDADGTFTFNFTKDHSRAGWYGRVHLSIAQRTDRAERLFPELMEQCGKVYPVDGNQLRWFVTKREDIEMLLPRLIKHMVIKARHWQRLLNMWRAARGKLLLEADVENIKAESEKSRLDTGPIKPKNFPTWAWVTGYLEGDGCFCNRYYKARKQHSQFVTVRCHSVDEPALRLLQKAFGGTIRPISKRDHLIEWWRSLGIRDASFAEHFLNKVLRHARMKRHHLETFLHTVRQRLSEKTPAGEATV